MKLRTVSTGLSLLLPCAGILALGTLTVKADPEERTGADAPHHERNLAKNEKRSALPLSDVTVPAFSGTQKPVRKATAVKSAANDRKSRDKKKADQQAKERQKADEAAAAEAERQRQRDDTPVEDFVGRDAPHQERSSDTNRRAARLFILER